MIVWTSVLGFCRWLTEISAGVGLQGCLGFWPGSKTVGVLRRALRTLRTVHLVGRRVLADPTITWRGRPERWVWHWITSGQEGVEEVIVCLVGLWQHLLSENTIIRPCETTPARQKMGGKKDLQRMLSRNYIVQRQTAFSVSRTFGCWPGQVRWFPWCPAPSWQRLPAFWSNSHSSFSVPLFWSNSQSSSSVSSHPWIEIPC